MASQTYHKIRRGAPIPKADHRVVGVATNVRIRASNSKLIILDIVSVCGRNAVYDARSVIILFFIIKPARGLDQILDSRHFFNLLRLIYIAPVNICGPINFPITSVPLLCSESISTCVFISNLRVEKTRVKTLTIEVSLILPFIL